MAAPRSGVFMDPHGHEASPPGAPHQSHAVLTQADSAAAGTWRAAFEFDWDAEDRVSWLEFTRITSPDAQARSAARRRNAIRTLPLWLFCPIGAYVAFGAGPEPGPFFFFLAALSLLSIVVFPPFFSQQMRRFPTFDRQHARSRLMHMPEKRVHIELTGDGIRASAPKYVLQYSWAWFQTCTIAGSLFVLVGEENDTLSIPIRKLGATAGEQKEQMDRIREHILTHGGEGLRRMRQYLAENNFKCPRCGYQLSGLTLTNCPECQLPVALENVQNPAATAA